MASAVTIAVRRQVVDAEVQGTERDGLAVQRHLSGSVEAVVARALQAALDGVVTDEDHLVVDRLEIAVDEISLPGLDDTLADAIRREAAAFFRRHLPEPQPAGAGKGTRSSSDAGGIVRRTPAATVEEAFEEFLRTGRLPWSFRLPAGSSMEQLVGEAWDGGSREPVAGESGWEGVRRALVEPRARQRLVRQFSPSFVDGLVRRLDPAVAASLADVAGAGGPSSPAWTRFVREVRLAAVAAAAVPQAATAEQLARRALATLPARPRTDTVLVAQVARRWPPAGAGVPRAAPGPVTPTGTRTVVGGEPLPEPAATAAAAPEPDGPSWLVANAGLVLVHPFLPRFLEGLGLAAGDRLRDPERAVALLHHLATGDRDLPEHEATVAKVLCGWPLEDPVERDPDLTQAELAESAAVLGAVVSHWEALRNTSPDALRAEFLSRPGALSVEGDDWVLRVEDRSVDILLEQLPWGVSLVRTPWMARLLRVEWRT